jgi:hypothetical protein
VTCEAIGLRWVIVSCRLVEDGFADEEPGYQADTRRLFQEELRGHGEFTHARAVAVRSDKASSRRVAPDQRLDIRD